MGFYSLGFGVLWFVTGVWSDHGYESPGVVLGKRLVCVAVFTGPDIYECDLDLVRSRDVVHKVEIEEEASDPLSVHHHVDRTSNVGLAFITASLVHPVDVE